MPNLVLAEWWWGQYPGSVGNSSWTSLMQNPYSIILGDATTLTTQ
jgi:hypothetical protein